MNDCEEIKVELIGEFLKLIIDITDENNTQHYMELELSKEEAASLVKKINKELDKTKEN